MNIGNLTARKSVIGGVVAAGLALISGPALATVSLEFIVDGTSILTVTDGDANDGNNFTNQVSFSGTIGDAAGDFDNTAPISTAAPTDEYRINLSFTRSEDSIADLLFEQVDVDALSGVTDGQVLTIIAKDDDFAAPPEGVANASTSITPTTVNTGLELDFESIVDGTTVMDENNIPEGSNQFSSKEVNVTAPYEIRHIATFRANSNINTGDTVTFDATTTVSVPAPATLGLLGVGLIGLGALARRRKSAA